VKPILFSWGRFHVAGYGLMIALGGALVFALMYPRKKELGLKTDEQFWLFVNLVLFTGPVCGRLLYVFEYTRPFSIEFWNTLFSGWGAFSMLGAFIGMPLVFWAFARWNKIPVLLLFDGCSLMACAWQILARTGCLLAGCCHGRPTSLPWGIVFTNPQSQVPPQWLGVPLHPTQPLEVVGVSVMTVFLYRAFNREAGSGLVTAMWFGLYGALRFVLEFLRGDTVPGLWGLTGGQILGLGCVAAAGALLVRRAKTKSVRSSRR
jgi:phosphatidylglycerol:prolipoprotein diacylglycerol transferase